jgi:hypothetical protein
MKSPGPLDGNPMQPYTTRISDKDSGIRYPLILTLAYYILILDIYLQF